VRTNVEGDADPARRDPRDAGRALHPDLVVRGLRHRGLGPDGRVASAQPAQPVRGTKAGADRLAYSYFVTYELPIIIVRPFNNYGPRQHPEKVIPRFITQALCDEPLTIHGDGHATRDWLYVDDDAEAIEA
jgi:nucleoside-diphosphate-sugar epimerase